MEVHCHFMRRFTDGAWFLHRGLCVVRAAVFKCWRRMCRASWFNLQREKRRSSSIKIIRNRSEYIVIGAILWTVMSKKNLRTPKGKAFDFCLEGTFFYSWELVRCGVFWPCLFSGWLFSRFILYKCVVWWHQVLVWLGIFNVTDISGNAKIFQTNLSRSILRSIHTFVWLLVNWTVCRQCTGKPVAGPLVVVKPLLFPNTIHFNLKSITPQTVPQFWRRSSTIFCLQVCFEVTAPCLNLVKTPYEFDKLLCFMSDHKTRKWVHCRLCECETLDVERSTLRVTKQKNKSAYQRPGWVASRDQCVGDLIDVGVRRMRVLSTTPTTMTTTKTKRQPLWRQGDPRIGHSTQPKACRNQTILLASQTNVVCNFNKNNNNNWVQEANLRPRVSLINALLARTWSENLGIRSFNFDKTRKHWTGGRPGSVGEWWDMLKDLFPVGVRPDFRCTEPRASCPCHLVKQHTIVYLAF